MSLQSGRGGGGVGGGGWQVEEGGRKKFVSLPSFFFLVLFRGYCKVYIKGIYNAPCDWLVGSKSSILILFYSRG